LACEAIAILYNMRFEVKLASVLTALCLLLPALALAQTDLQSAVRAAITQDPRSAQMSPAQLESLIAVLSEGAQARGMTPEDIAWRPAPTLGSGEAVSDFCAPYPRFLCVMSATYGFYGPDYLMPIWLAVASLLFLLVNALLRHEERAPRAAAPNLQ